MEPTRAAPPARPYFRQHAWRVASVALVVLLLATTSALALRRDSLAPLIWLPSGIALAAVLDGGWRYWPVALGGAIGAFLLPGLSAGQAGPLALALAAEPLIAAALLQRLYTGDWRQTGLRGYLLLVFVASVIPPALTATVARGAIPAMPWTEWWMGASLGIAFVTPCALGVLCRRRPADTGTWLHAAFFSGVFAVAHYIVFFAALEEAPPVGFLLFPLMIWCALRFGIAATSAALLASLLVAHAGDLRGTGFFAQTRDTVEPLHFWLYYAMLGLSAMTLAVLTDEDRSIRRALMDRESLLRAIYDASSVAIFLVDRQGRLSHANRRMAEMFGWSPEELAGTDYVTHVHPADREEARQRTFTLLASPVDRRVDLERLYQRRDGTQFWGHLSGGHLRDAAGEVIGLIGVVADITARKEAEDRIRHMAQYDHLTGLPNRALFYDRLQQALAAAHRYERRFALLFIDLDNFKPVNDTHGHETGDALLREVAARLRAHVRAADTAARHGGDEFVVLAPEIRDIAEVRALADKLLAVIGAPYEIQGLHLAVTPSIGVALYPRDGEDADTLLRHADAAMYQAKNGGRNRVVMPD